MKTGRVKFAFLICISVFVIFPLPSSLLVSASGNGDYDIEDTVFVTTDSFTILDSHDSLIPSSVRYVYVFNFAKTISIRYVYANGTVIYRNDAFSAPYKVLSYVPDASLQISKDSKVLFFSILHPATVTNIAIYRAGKDASTPGLARFNMILCLVFSIPISAVLTKKVINPKVVNRVIKLN